MIRRDIGEVVAEVELALDILGILDEIALGGGTGAPVGGGGVTDHALLLNVTSDQHHAQLHNAEHEIGGGDLVDHDLLTNYVANEHIDHSAVNIIAGVGLSGGGAITADITLDIDDIETLPTSLLAGSVVFSDGSNLAEDNANLFWDDTNNRLGIGITTPNAVLHTSSSDVVSARFNRESASYGGQFVMMANNATKWSFKAGYTANIFDLAFMPASGIPALLIQQGGNVGIGTVTPEVPLHVHRGTSGVVTRYRNGGWATEVNFLAARASEFLIGGGSGDGIGIAVNGETTASLSVIVGGNVGIGTTAPGGKLHIWTGSANANAGGAGDELVIEGSGNTGISILSPAALDTNIFFGSNADSSGATLKWNANADLFKIGTTNANAEVAITSGNGVEAVRIDDDGNVGIGTATPGGKLHIKSGASGATAAGEATDIILEKDQASGMSFLFPNASGGRINFGYPDDNDGGRIFYGGPANATASNQDSMQFFTNGSRRMVIDKNGNVGIGETAPQAFLHITGAANEKIRLEDSVGSTWGITTNNSNEFVISDITNSKSPFVIEADAASNTLVIDTNDRVGIGTTTPTGPFHVQGLGNAFAESAFFTTSDWVSTTTGSGIGIRCGADTGNTYTQIQALDAGGNSTNDLVLNPTGGKVGIGTTVPIKRFSVNYNLAETSLIANAGVNENGRLLLFNTNATVDSYSSFDIRASSADVRIAAIYKSVNTCDFAILVDNGGLVERLRILANGNVGIGTVAPGAKLEILSATNQLRLTHTDGIDECDFFVDGDGELFIKPTSKSMRLGAGEDGDASFKFWGDTTTYELHHVEDDGALRLSAEDAGNYAEFRADGSLVFAGTAGLAYGEISVKDNAVATTLNSGAEVQLTVFDIDGPSNNTEPDQANNEITITEAGHYLVTISIHVNNNAAQTHVIDVSLNKNNGARIEFANVHGHRTLTGGSGDVGSMSLSGIVDLAVDDELQLWATTDIAADRSVTFEDITLSIVQIGGT